MTLAPVPSVSAVAAAVGALMDDARAELAELVAFRSVAGPEHGLLGECRAAARWVAGALRSAGLDNVRELLTPDGSLSVYGCLPGPPTAPTVLLYAHYDVQPAPDEQAWHGPPFELREGPDGRWYGRGSADCKGAVILHLLALRALAECGGVPVTVKVIVEGSEEQGTGGLQRYAEAHPELLRADAVVVADTGNVRAGVPTVVTSLRGAVLVRVTVRTLRAGVHSGQFGGAAPDALLALARLLASLHDDAGDLAIDGLTGAPPWEGDPYPEDGFRHDAGVLDGVRLMGTGPVADRLWTRPSATVLGIDCPSVPGATPSVPAEVRALLCLRVPAGISAATAETRLAAQLRARAPWGARVETETVGGGEAFRADTTTPAHRAMDEALRAAYGGTPVRTSGLGGSIPLCGTLASLYPEAEILLTGLGDPEARVHAPNESVDPRELERMTIAEALFLCRLEHHTPPARESSDG